jgi:alkyl hydroperoxide reductase subunit F
MGVRFAGLPLGHEFTSLVLALLQVGGHPPEGRSPTTIEQIRALDGDLRFETYCLAVLPQLPGRGAGAEPDGGAQPAHPAHDDRRRAFQDEVEDRQVHGGADSVPQRRSLFGQGRMTLEEILAKIDTGAAARDAAALADKRPVRRADRRRRPGGRGGCDLCGAQGHPHRHRRASASAARCMDTLGIENFISVTDTEGPELGRRAGAARADLRGRRDEPAAGRAADPCSDER